MEIQALKLVVSEQDINELARQVPLNGAPVRDLLVVITEQGVSVRGRYHAWISVAFETMWLVTIESGKIRAHLADVKVVGMPAALIKGMMTEMLSDSLASPGISVEGEVLWIDLDTVLAKQGFPARTNLTGVRCTAGKLFIESALGTER
jgi:hypothetical protein